MKIKIYTFVLLMLFAAALFTFRLLNWPTIWYDEGLHLQVAKNLALFGRYGIQSTEGFRIFDPLVTTGPTVLMPIALVFKWLGVNLLWARAVIVLYALLAVMLYFLVMGELFNFNTAVVASLLLIALSASFDDISGSFLALSRMVMGDVPALFWMLAGSYLWLRYLSKDGYIAMMGAGLCFGLAMITKPQYLLIIGTLALIYVVDRIWYHQLRPHQILIPVTISIAVITLWYIYQSSLSTNNNIGELVVLDRMGIQISLFSFSLILRGLRVLLASGVLIWGVPGLVYSSLKIKDKDISGIKVVFLLVFCLLWFFWYIFGSISWIRYALPAIVIMIGFMAALLVDLTENFVFITWRQLSGENAPIGQLRVVKSLAVTMAILLMVVVPLEVRVKDIIKAPDASLNSFVSFIQQNVPAEAVIETTEPEIAFLSDRNFHQPTLDVQDAAIRFVQLNQPYPPNFYPEKSINPDYLVLGPYSRWTQLYEDWLKGSEYTRLVSIGGYDLLEMKESEKP